MFPPSRRCSEPCGSRDRRSRSSDDLEWLLNSKQTVVEIPTDLKHLRGSLLTFGLPDFTHASLARAEDQRALQRNIVDGNPEVRAPAERGRGDRGRGT